jgi:hypothetical protein
MAKGGSNDEAERARRDEEERQARIRSGTARIDNVFDKQFTPSFYKGQETAYKDYAVPQLDKQHEDAGEELGFDLARRGGLQSSVRADKEADLGELYDLKRQEVTGKAREFGTTARTNVEDARNDLILTLQSTGDASGAAKSALSRAGALSRPPAYSPLEDAFLSFTQGLGTQAGLERAAAAGSPYKPRHNTGLFGGSGSVKVT